MDSDTKKEANREEELTKLPSLWITLSELDELSKELGVYNQVTVRTKRNRTLSKRTMKKYAMKKANSSSFNWFKDEEEM